MTITATRKARTVPVLSYKAEMQLDIYPSLSRHADDTRLCWEPVSTTAFSSFPSHCKSKKRWEVMCGVQDEHRECRVSAPHELSSCQLIPAPLHAWEVLSPSWLFWPCKEQMGQPQAGGKTLESEKYRRAKEEKCENTLGQRKWAWHLRRRSRL